MWHLQLEHQQGDHDCKHGVAEKHDTLKTQASFGFMFVHQFPFAVDKSLHLHHHAKADEVTTTLRRKTESFSHSIKIRGVEPRTATDHACIAIRCSRLIRAVRRIVANVNIITPLSDIPRYVVNSP